MRVTVWRSSTTLASPVRAAGQRHDWREHLFASIEHEGVEGYGEVSPQPAMLNGDPSTESVIEALRAETLVRLGRTLRDTGELPPWFKAHRLAGPRAASSVAWSLLEMALLDRTLRVGQTRLDALWPARRRPATVATVSLVDDEPWSVPPSAARVRAKVRPGSLRADRVERLASLGRPVIVDYNCSGASVDAVARELESLGDAVPIVAVEQPFAPGNLISHAQLAARQLAPVSLDEGLRSLLDLRLIARYRAASIVCVKPARVGGLAAARTIIDAAQRAGIRPYVGGFFESPLARTTLRNLAAAFVDEPSDVAPVRTRAKSGLEHAVDGIGYRPRRGALDEIVLEFES